MAKQSYDINLEAHLRYVRTQKHTGNDLHDAIKGHARWQGKKKEDEKYGCSDQVETFNAFENPSAGNTRYMTLGGKHKRLSRFRCHAG